MSHILDTKTGKDATHFIMHDIQYVLLGWKPSGRQWENELHTCTYLSGSIQTVKLHASLNYLYRVE